MTAEEWFHELSYYTLAQPSAEFMHQYVVDAYGAQMASASDKPTRLAFALVGLYLHVELGYSGKQVQLVHTRLAQPKAALPHIDVPQSRGAVSIKEVLDTPAGPERDKKIDEWCESIWSTFCHNRSTIVALLDGLVPQGPN